MRSFLLATTLGAAQSLAVANKSKKPAIQALMESATTMLKNGATPDVARFATETLDEVSSVVIPAIINESVNDQAFIRSLYSRFDAIRSTLQEGNGDIFQLNYEERLLSSEHKACRDVEADRCYDKRECEMALYRLWETWVSEENTLRDIHGRGLHEDATVHDTYERGIHGHFCAPNANGTLHEFRVESVPLMQAYMTQKDVVDLAEGDYDAKVPDCRLKHQYLDEQSITCNGLQTDLEEKACAHALRINEVLHRYYDDFAQAQSAYNCAVEEIMQLEKDRKREWVTLQVVNCLINRIHDQNGAPCDDETGTVTEAVGVCEQEHSIAVCSTEHGEPRLCLEYPRIPEDPPDCGPRDTWIQGEARVCLATEQPKPCNGDWNEQEYANLPVVPVAEFTSTNPGCNAYPECVGCYELDTPAFELIDSCPGYQANGCEGTIALHDSQHNAVSEHEFIFNRTIGGIADVRCCSIDGETCQSQNFEGGVDFQTPNDSGIHHGCYFGVTYQEAMGVCHNAGMRICTADEVQACCGTGCWHNHHAIWVDVADQHDGTNSLHQPQVEEPILVGR